VDIERFLADERLPDDYRLVVERVHAPLVRAIVCRQRERAPFVVGLCGPQGSGKSTMARAMRLLLQEQGVSAAVLSLDDLYLTRAQREALARQVHPLLATRGVPGTHDIALGVRIIEALASSQHVAMPVFDKASDDRKPPSDWPKVQGPVQVLLFEGWCVGALAQDDAALAEPINELERECDPHGIWRTYVNEALRLEYPKLFQRLDALVLLHAPAFEVVYAWRLEQEHKLRASAKSGCRIMSDAEVARFVAHYERLTRHILSEMPGRADAVVRLGSKRELLALECKGTETGRC